MQEYYNNETARTEDFEKDNDELNAKKAREMTNAAIINLIKKEVFPKIAEKANRGKCEYSFAMSRKIDYKVGMSIVNKKHIQKYLFILKKYKFLDNYY